MSKNKRCDRTDVSRAVSYYVVWRGGIRDLEQEVKDLIAKNSLVGSANEGYHGGVSVGYAWWDIVPGKEARDFRKKLDSIMEGAHTRALSLSYEQTMGNLFKILNEAEYREGLKK